jgi:integrase
MVCVENRRGRICIKFSIRGVKDANGKTRFFRHTYEAKWTDENKRKYKKHEVMDIKAEIDGRSWKALLERFPGNEPLHTCGLVAGGDFTMDKAFDLYEEDYADNEGRCPKDLGYKLGGDAERCKGKSPREYFAGLTPAQMTSGRIVEYRRYLKSRGYANATVNHKIGCVLHTLKLLAGDGKLDAMPVVRKMKIDNKRTGRFERHEMDAMVQHLPWHEQIVCWVGYFVGWRETAICTRTKAHYDGEFMVLDKAKSKNKECYEFPVDIEPELKALLAKQAAWVRQLEVRLARPIEWLFPTPKGDRVKRFDDAWKTACRKAGLVAHRESGDPYLFHDFRRTATKNLRDRGYSKDEVMDLVGHKTDSIHRDYDKQNRDRLRQLVAKAQPLPASNVIPLSRRLVPHVSHNDGLEGQSQGQELKKVSNLGAF